MPRGAALALLACLPLACSRGPCARVEEGCRVKLAFTAEADGRRVDAASRSAPAELVVGSGAAVPGLDRGLRGLAAGESRTIALAPSEAFGERDEAAVQDVPRGLFARFGALREGMTVMGLRGGRAAEGRIVALSTASVRVDFNHPLAGKTVVYRVEVLQVGRP